MDPSSSQFSRQSQKMMEIMGYREGEGLGAEGQGVVEPINPSQQFGHRGLGFSHPVLNSELVDWEEEKVVVKQQAEWFPQSALPPLTEQDLEDAIKIGNRKTSIDDETTFIDKSILSEILSSKSAFDGISQKEFIDARNRANPFETIKCGIFQNRAAMKMANIDSICNFMFTDHKFDDGENLEPLYFADLCAGPGGFSEYVLWKKKWQSMGFGTTLKNQSNDFQLTKFNKDSPTGTFQCIYGADNTGDITKSENIRFFQEHVLRMTKQKGVHFVMADGGISVEGNENIQEVLTKQLVLCQFLTAVSVLRKGGHFMCKTFDTFLPFTSELIYLMFRSFDRICILKPHTSRPANSERYFIGRGFKEFKPPICYHLFAVNDKLNELQGSNTDVEHIFHFDTVQADHQFYPNFVDSVQKIANKQVYSLKKVAAYIKNRALLGENQDQIREDCLKEWGISADRLQSPRDNKFQRRSFHYDTSEIEKKFSTLIGATDVRSMRWSCVTPDTLHPQKSHLRYTDDWVCVPTTARYQDRCFILGIWNDYSFAFCQAMSSNSAPKWFQVRAIQGQGGLRFPESTVLEAEFVQEYDRSTKRLIPALHIIDAIQLGSTDVRSMSYKQRIKMLEVFLHVHCEVFQSSAHMPVRIKPHCGIKEIAKLLEQLPDHHFSIPETESICTVAGFYMFPFKFNNQETTHVLSYRRCLESRISVDWPVNPVQTLQHSVLDIVRLMENLQQ